LENIDYGQVGILLLDTSMTVGQRFKRMRAEKGFSQAQLAEGICSYSVISQIECDRALPSARTLGKLAEKLGVPLREIMGMQEKQMEAGFQLDIVHVHLVGGDYVHAMRLIEELEQRDDLLEHQKRALLTCRAECYIRAGHPAEAVKILLPFIEQQEIQRSVDDVTMCDVYDRLGTAYFKLRDFEKAFSAYEHGYHISLRFPQQDQLSAQVAKNLGLTCNQLGLKEEARKYLEKAYEFYHAFSDMKSLADSLFALAMSTNTEHHLKQALTLYESLNAVREAHVVKQHHAYHVEAKRDTRKALAELDEAAEEFDRIGEEGMCVYTLSRAAMICLEHDEIEAAEGYLQQAHLYKDSMAEEDRYLLADYFKTNALYHLRKENFDECVFNAQSASEICGKMGLYAESADSLQICANVYQLQGKFQEAYETSSMAYQVLRLSGRRNSK
jgi:transcriptional regulator with XRE-family HTH domain